MPDVAIATMIGNPVFQVIPPFTGTTWPVM